MLTKETIIKYLGRSLTPTEDTNFDIYLGLAVEQLYQLLCMDVTYEASATRTFDGRLGYKLLYIDPLTAPTSVKVDGETITSEHYTLRQWDNRNASWFNTIEFDCEMTGDVEITGNWGFQTLPDDLSLLLARLFTVSSGSSADRKVKSKKIEDFTVTYEGSDSKEADENSRIVYKYSNCRTGDIRHGRICPVYESTL